MSMVRTISLAIIPFFMASCGDGENGKDADADIEITVEDVLPDPVDDRDAPEDPAAEEAVEDVVEEEPEIDAPPPIATCPSFDYGLVEGLNVNFEANGKMRDFVLVLPEDIETETGPWPVVFVWHGHNGDTDWATSYIVDLVDDPGFTFIGVAPESLHLALPDGYEWDMLDWDPEDSDDEFLFDNILACLEEAFDVDENHVHSMGFSAGAIMTNLLSMDRGEVLASVASFSGANFTDPDQVPDPRLLTWPEYDLTNTFTALVVWGGETDQVAVPPFITFDFNASALSSISFLNGHGHDAVGCNHGEGHSVPDSFSFVHAVEFFKDHPLGVHPTPYAADGLPDSFPDFCEVHTAE